jgi:hypothetical protein
MSIFHQSGGLRKHLKFRHKILQPEITILNQASLTSTVPTRQDETSLPNTENNEWPSQTDFEFNSGKIFSTVKYKSTGLMLVMDEIKTQ